MPLHDTVHVDLRNVVLEQIADRRLLRQQGGGLTG